MRMFNGAVRLPISNAPYKMAITLVHCSRVGSNSRCHAGVETGLDLQDAQRLSLQDTNTLCNAANCTMVFQCSNLLCCATQVSTNVCGKTILYLNIFTKLLLS